MTGGQLIEEHVVWMGRRGLRDQTIYHRRRRLLMTDELIGLVDATPESIERMLDSREGRGGRPLAARTRRTWISHLSSFYAWAVDWEHLPHDPTKRLIRPRLPRALPRPVDEAILEEAIRQAPPMLAAWLTLAGYAGLRCHEIAELERSDVLDDQDLLRIAGKGGTERLVPIGSTVWAALAAHGLPDRGPVFTRPDGRPWGPSDVSRHASMHLQLLGFDAVMHQLRHRFGTQVQSECGDLRVTQELMGHADPATTAGYAAYSRTRARRAVEALDELDQGAA